MIVWTIQPYDALRDIETKGVFRCDETKSFNLTKPDSLQKPYRWMMEQMRKRIGEQPQGVHYPIWAWHTWDGERVCPDPDSAAFLQRTDEKVLFTLDIPENELVLTDFDLWQFALMDTFVPDTKEEPDFEKMEAMIDALEGEALEQAIEQSWQNVFQINNGSDDTQYRSRFIQATFWEIRKSYIVETKRLLPNAAP